MLLPIRFHCAHCGEELESLADPSGGVEQEYVEDCQVCCAPNTLRIRIEEDGAVVEWVD